jgi:hypothetical protein
MVGATEAPTCLQQRGSYRGLPLRCPNGRQQPVIVTNNPVMLLKLGYQV